MNRVMTAGLDRRWRRLTRRGGRAAGRPRARRVLRHRRPRGRRRAGGRRRHRPRLLGAHARARAPEVGRRSSGSRATCSRCRSPTARSTPPRSASASATSRTSSAACASCAACCAPAGGSRSSRSRSRAASLRPFFSLWFDRIVPLLGRVLPGGKAYTYLPASVRALPGGRGARGAARARRLRAGPVPPARRLDRRAAHGDCSRSVSATLEARSRCRRPGLAGYLAERRGRGSPQAVARRTPGSVAAVGAEALAAGGKRLRPLLRFLSAPAGDAGRRSPQASRSSSCTWRRSSTTTSSTAPACAAARRPPGRRTAPTPRAPPATTSSRARSPSSPGPATSSGVGDARRRVPRARARRGAPAAPAHDPDTTIDAYLERCALKTGKLFEAACLLGRRQRARYGRLARDRVPDRRRHPRLRRRDDRDREDPRHRPPRGHADAAAAARRPARTTSSARALAGGPLDGALVRVAATDALAALPRGGARLR